MTAMICLLRGVNVGGHNMIKMDALRALCESLGHCSAQTYVQSGNVVFQTSERDPIEDRRENRSAIEKKLGFRPDVILRTAAEMSEVIARNPFAKRKGIEPGKLIVTFLADEPSRRGKGRGACAEARPGRNTHEWAGTLHVLSRGYRPLEARACAARKLKNKGTARNWNTVVKLLEMAEKLEKSG